MAFNRQIRPHRQTHDALGRLFGDWRAIRATQVLVGRLFVKRNGVVNGGGNPGLGELRLHGFAVIKQNGELREHACTIVTLHDPLHAFSIERGIVGVANLDALLNLPLETFQFGQHDRALNGVHPAANADTGVDVPLALSMNPDLAARLGNRVVAGEDRAAVTVAAERLAREETRASDVAQVATLASLVFGAKALGGVLDHDQLVAVGDRVDLVHVGRLAVEAHRHDGLGARGDGGLDLGGVDIAGVRLDIHEDRLGAEQHDDLGRRNEGKRGRDDLVTRLDPHRHQADQQGFGAAGHGDAVLGPGIGFELLLEFAHLRAHDVLAMLQHLVHALLDGIFEGAVLGLEIDERDCVTHGQAAFLQTLFSRT